jgi:hypothetical protein
VLGVLAVSVTSCPAASVTVEGLLREMVDMQRLASMPDPYYDSDQQSSYDRASTAPDKEGWFANGDAGQFIREEDRGGHKEWVMAEMDGPGVICRIWSANPEGGGTIRIYIDDMERPALEEDFLKLTSAELPAFPAPFSHRLAMGANLYFPIPYQKHCKCTVDKPSLYYQIGYRTYPAGTVVEPFSMDVLSQVKATMDEVGAVLASPERRFTTEGAEREARTLELAPGQTGGLKLAGPSAVVRMELTPDVPKEQQFAALRESLLTVRFDGEKTPSIWAPLGDFFGSQPGINPYASLPVGMRENGLCYANWYMPFGKTMELDIKNESAGPVKLRLAVWTKPTAAAAPPLTFHAKWRNEWLPREPEFLDWRLLDCTGPGRFVGVMLGVMNTQSGWWGEGDEKVWVDDDRFPSYFGTGSEDYFGYAWCCPALFTHAYHNQSICTGPGNFGYTSVARYHLSDDIPFRKSMKFDIEKWSAADREYCCTTYWYAAPGATDFFTPVPVGQRRVRPLPEPFKVKGALEGEQLEIARCTGGGTSLQDVGGDFSGNRQLWWTQGKEGAVLELKVPVEKAGRYTITLGLTKSWDYGIHQPMVNGQDAGPAIDLYTPPPFRPLKVELGEFDLAAGTALIGLRCVGTNPAADPANYMAGIDYLLLQPVP